MGTSVDTLSGKALPRISAGQPPVAALVMIFWCAFAVAAVMTQLLNPALFERQDPDSFLRLVQVRDLLHGQGWFDLVQHRIDPPRGVLMHWSRVIDAPLAALVVLGEWLGLGDQLALTAWPLLLLLGFMASVAAAATALGGRAAAVPALLLSLLFFAPLQTFVPNTIDHHNAQLALVLGSLACVLQLRERPLCGFVAGLFCAISTAIGLEMALPTAILGAAIALRWGFDPGCSRGAALFGVAFAAGAPLLYILTGSPDAAHACDALSWSQAAPAGVAGSGLAVLTVVAQKAGTAARLAGLLLLAAITAATMVLVAPDCLAGPYGALSADLQTKWLSTIAEAQPLMTYLRYDPVSALAEFAPPLAALWLALRQARCSIDRRAGWLLSAALIALPLGMSFYEIRTLPLANAVAVPVLGAWLAELARRRGITSWRPLRKAAPLGAAFALVLPATYYALGGATLAALSWGTHGQLRPIARADVPAAAGQSLSPAEKDCFDASSAALLAQTQPGLVVAPVTYGSTVLALSGHSVLAAPYHRGGQAILDAIRATDLPPEAARAVFTAHAADYLAICSTSQETALTAQEAPGGLLAQLLGGSRVAWLQPIQAKLPTTLRLWRVVR